MKTIDDARPLFAEGKSVNAVSRELEISYYEAGKLKATYDAEQAADEEAEPEEVATDSALWDVTIQVPSDGIDLLLGSLDHKDAIDALLSLDTQAKCTVWGAVMQRRINDMLRIAVPESEAA